MIVQLRGKIQDIEYITLLKDAIEDTDSLLLSRVGANASPLSPVEDLDSSSIRRGPLREPYGRKLQIFPSPSVEIAQSSLSFGILRLQGVVGMQSIVIQVHDCGDIFILLHWLWNFVNCTCKHNSFCRGSLKRAIYMITFFRIKGLVARVALDLGFFKVIKPEWKSGTQANFCHYEMK